MLGRRLLFQYWNVQKLTKLRFRSQFYPAREKTGSKRPSGFHTPRRRVPLHATALLQRQVRHLHDQGRLEGQLHWRGAFDALVFGYYQDGKLIYAARTRNGFTPKLRAELIKKFKPLETSECPFANLPEAKAGRWGAGLTVAKMEACRWLKPQLVGQFEFVEWTEDGHLRHSRFMSLRDDKKAEDVRRE